MARTNDEADAFEIEVLEGEADHHRRVGHAADDEIRVAGAQQREKVVVGAGDDSRMNTGIVGSEDADRFGQDARGYRRQSADPHGRRFVHAGCGIYPLAQRGDAGGSVAVEHFAEGGERQPAAAAVEQFRAQELLELLDGLGRRGLADMQHLGGIHHALEAHDFEEAGDVPELDARIDGMPRQRVLRL